MAWRMRLSFSGGRLAFSMKKNGKYGRPGEDFMSRAARSSSGMRWGGTVWIQLKRPVCSPVSRTVSSAGA